MTNLRVGCWDCILFGASPFSNNSKYLGFTWEGHVFESGSEPETGSDSEGSVDQHGRHTRLFDLNDNELVLGIFESSFLGFTAMQEHAITLGDCPENNTSHIQV